MTCPKCQSTRVIGIEIPTVYDGVAYWQCGSESCTHKWHRFSKGDYVRDRLKKLCPRIEIAERPA